MSGHSHSGRLTSILNRLFRRLRTSAPIPVNTAPLARLPAEIFDLILEDLDLETLFLLSRTCRHARLFLHRDWRAEVRKTYPGERMRFLHRIAHLMPDYLACAGCRKLHLIDPNDTPENPTYSRRGCLDARSCHCVRNWSRAQLEYLLVHNHVQLALKYTRLNTRAEYLARLMKCHSRREDRQWHSEVTMDVRTTEAPKIVDERFLNETVWDLRRKDGREIRPCDIHSACPMICMHISLQPAIRYVLGRHDRGVWPQSRDMYDHLSCVSSPAPGRRLFCDECGADFDFQLDEKRWVVRSWRDFGTETETTCIMDSAWKDLNWTHKHVKHMTRGPTTYVPGSIETMYKRTGGLK